MKLTVSQKKTTPISKDLIGVFFEDINYHFWTANLPKDASLPRHTCSNLTE